MLRRLTPEYGGSYAAGSGTPREEVAILSARNRFKGRIKEVKLGQVMAEVIITVGDMDVVSIISRASAERMGLKAGDEAAAAACPPSPSGS